MLYRIYFVSQGLKIYQSLFIMAEMHHHGRFENQGAKRQTKISRVISPEEVYRRIV